MCLSLPISSFPPLLLKHVGATLIQTWTIRRTKKKETFEGSAHVCRDFQGFVIFKSLIYLSLFLPLFPSRPVKSDKSTPCFYHPSRTQHFRPLPRFVLPPSLLALIPELLVVTVLLRPPSLLACPSHKFTNFFVL